MSDPLVTACRHLAVLDLKPGVAWPEVRRAYRLLVQVWHPDRFADKSPIQLEAAERLKAINQSYAWLSDHKGLLTTLEGQSGALDTTPGPEWSHPRAGSARESVHPSPDLARRMPRKKADLVTRWQWRLAVGVALVAFFAGLALYSLFVRSRRDDGGWTLGEETQAAATAEIAAPPEPRDYFFEVTEAYVAVDRLHVREHPSIASRVVDTLHLGERVEIDAAQGPWRRVLVGDPIRELGWVHVDFVAPAAPAETDSGDAPLPGRPAGPTAPEPDFEPARE